MTVLTALEFLLAVVGMGLVVLATVWMLRRASTLLAGRRRAGYRRVLPLVEVILVAGALIVVAGLLGAQPGEFAAVVVAVVALLVGTSWFALRDVVAGAVLRTEDAFETGQWIRAEGVEGRIREVGVRTLEVEREDGTRVRLPYSRVASSPLVRAGRAEDPAGHTFSITLPLELGPARMTPVIRAAARNSFYVSATRPPQVHATSGPDGHRYDVTVFTLDRAFLPEVEGTVRRRVDAEREDTRPRATPK
jgi:small-conductance mechanosensitive channel